MTDIAQFLVGGENIIHCESCEQRIRNALRRLPGIERVEASHQTQQVVVDFDPAQVDPDTIRAKLVQAGFEASRQERGSA